MGRYWQVDHNRDSELVTMVFGAIMICLVILFAGTVIIGLALQH